jgi:gamma-glutamyltranspeptidase/glutathione hydrolase
VHFEDGVLFAEPGIDMRRLHGPHGSATEVVSFGELNLFFGGVQAVHRLGEELCGAGDPRRGGVAVQA